MPDEKQRLSYSRINTFLNCRRKYYWNYIERLVPIDKADYFQVGIVVHELRERWIKGELQITDFDTLKQKIQSAYPDNDPERTEKVTLEAAVLFNGYVQHFEEDTFKLVSPEMHIEADMGEYVLYARLDGLALDQDGNYYIDELKTTSRMDSGYLQGLRKGLQSGIRYIITDRVLDTKPKGTLFEIIVKTKTPQYQRQPVLRDNWAVDYALETVEAVWLELKRCGDDKKLYYPSMNCSFGNYTCPYETLCRNDTPAKRQAFFTEYNPNQKRKEVLGEE